MINTKTHNENLVLLDELELKLIKTIKKCNNKKLSNRFINWQDQRLKCHDSYLLNESKTQVFNQSK